MARMKKTMTEMGPAIQPSHAMTLGSDSTPAPTTALQTEGQGERGGPDE